MTDTILSGLHGAFVPEHDKAGKSASGDSLAAGASAAADDSTGWRRKVYLGYDDAPQNQHSIVHIAPSF